MSQIVLKPNTVTIINIATTGSGTVFGLGDDQVIYRWDMTTGAWHLYKDGHS